MHSCISGDRSERPDAHTVHNLLCAELHRWSSVDGSLLPRKECIVCMNALRNTQIEPCGHEIMCSECVPHVYGPGKCNLCPVCRGEIERVIEGQQLGVSTMRVSVMKK